MLLDTHVVLWWLGEESSKLSRNAAKAIASKSNEIFLSAASVWETAIKHRLGKLPLPGRFFEELDQVLSNQGIRPLNIVAAHARMAGMWDSDHRDPFDRMLAAQARVEGLHLISSDRAFRELGIDTFW